MSQLVVMKFGGTSVGSAQRIAEVAQIISDARAKRQVVVVVSAMSGVTDLLVEAATRASEKNRSAFESALADIRDKHMEAIDALQLTPADKGRLSKVISHLLVELNSLLNSIAALNELTPRAFDLVLSFGERMSIQLVASALNKIDSKAVPVEATKLIITTDTFGDAQPLLEKSERKATRFMRKILSENIVPVVTGFIGASEQGITTTLGRGGSDYTATILGYCLNAHEVWIWTDVDGVMTADPRLIPHAHTLTALSYDEAAELSYFGAKVLHPLTMVPAAVKNIPIFIKNTFKPEVAGTRISKQVERTADGGKAITTMKHLSLITVQGKGMTGVPGVAAKVFSAVAAERVNVLFISQASSEFNISLVVKQADGERAVVVLREAFSTEMARHNIDVVRLEEGLAIVAVVGEGMKGHPGVAGKMFASLGTAKVNIIAIAQGSSERNISLVIAESDVPRAVRCIHDAFHLNGAAKTNSQKTRVAV